MLRIVLQDLCGSESIQNLLQRDVFLNHLLMSMLGNT